jgi:peptidoglycan-associated lipoprotein
MKPMVTALVLFLGIGLLACGGNRPAKSADSEASNKPRKVETKPQVTADANRKDDVAVGTDVRQACGIHEVKAAPVLADKPKFDFDSYDLTVEEKQVLDQIADCLVRGPLKGKRVTLVGRADPRGEGEYNMSLGAYRASAVKSYLGERGVEQQRMRETSRGALDATGQDEEGWREDRRVDITLAN